MGLRYVTDLVVCIAFAEIPSGHDVGMQSRKAPPACLNNPSGKRLYCELVRCDITPLQRPCTYSESFALLLPHHLRLNQ